MADVDSAPLPPVAVKLAPGGRLQTYAVKEGSPAPRVGDAAVVDTGNGLALGVVAPPLPREVAERRPPAEAGARQVVRIASHADVMTRVRQQQREAEALRTARMKIQERGLAMKVTRVEHAFDGSRLVFFFTADERIDFRDLVKDLGGVFRMRIEMRQIGARDEAKAIGGYGTCGRPLCCTTFLNSFEPVSIRMAKRQDLTLNPSRLSGLCGRLKCCLRYELPAGEGQSHEGSGSEAPDRRRCGGCSAGGCGSGTCGCRR
jgi:cell fate regulator YaaT (PSP1 superfamily)